MTIPSRLAHLLRTRHRVYWYPGFAGVPGYVKCLTCGQKSPDRKRACGGNKERVRKEQARWEFLLGRLANLDDESLGSRYCLVVVRWTPQKARSETGEGR